MESQSVPFTPLERSKSKAQRANSAIGRMTSCIGVRTKRLNGAIEISKRSFRIRKTTRDGPRDKFIKRQHLVRGFESLNKYRPRSLHGIRGSA